MPKEPLTHEAPYLIYAYFSYPALLKLSEKRSRYKAVSKAARVQTVVFLVATKCTLERGNSVTVSILDMEAAGSSEPFVPTYKTTGYHDPEYVYRISIAPTF
jgi:hypothetical protein